MSTLPAPMATLTGPAHDRVRGVQRRLARLGWARGAAWGIAAALATLILGAWIDLAIELSGPIRAGVDVTALIALLAVTIALIAGRRRAATLQGVAARLDELAKARGQIVTGLDLATAPAAAQSPLTRGLAQIAAGRAAELIRRVELNSAAPLGMLRRPLTAITCIAAFFLVVGAANPRLFATQWMRFTDPFGDHPPYSALQFNVSPGDTSVVYATSLDIHATTWGAYAGSVDLVYCPDGQSQQVIPMFPQSTGKWEATLANLVSPGDYFVRSGESRSPRYRIVVVTVPLIQKVDFRVTLPAYTHRAPYVGPLPQGGLAGLPGTLVEVRAWSNRPLSGGTLSLTTPAGFHPIPMSADANQAQAHFTITSPGKFQITVTDTDAQDSPQPFSGTFSLLKDQRPFVRIVDPPLLSFAAPDALIKITAIAEDDYGISSLQIYRGIDDSRFTAVDIPIPPAQPARWVGQATLALADLGVDPGDVIKIFARVEDNDPAGPKGSESTVAVIHVVSQADLDKMAMQRNALEVLQSKYAQAERRLEAADADAQRIEKELDSQDRSKPLTAAQKKEIEDLARRLAADSSAIKQLADHHLPVDIDAALTAQLNKVAGQFDSASAAAASIGRQGMPSGAAADQIRQLRRTLDQEKAQYNQEALEPLAYLAKILPLIADERRFIDLYRHQQDLADRMLPLEGHDGEDNPQLKARMRDLEDEQGEIRDALQSLLEDINSDAAALPSDPKLDLLRQTATQFAKAVGASPADGQMRDSQSSLDMFAGTQASASAHDAARTLSSFIHRCNGMGSCASQSLAFNPTLSDGLGDSINQLLAMGAVGMGGGAGGYSAYASSLDNIGLFGTIPLMSQESGNGGQADSGLATADNSAANGKTNPDAIPLYGPQRAQGVGTAPVPPQYQKRVDDYFQRVEDEMSN